MKLSILIPVYNAEAHIGRCLDSLLDQDISQRDYEIILRDDGSTDGSVNIIKSYDTKITNIEFTEDINRGAYVQRNILLNEASGDYVYFMDADDYLAPKSLNKILKYSIDNDLEIAGFNTYIATCNDDRAPVQDEINLNSQKIISGKDFIADNLDMRHEIWWYLIKKEFINSLDLKFKEGRYHNDVLFTLNLFLKAERVTFFPQIVYYYYQSSNSIMRSSDTVHNEKLILAGKDLILKYSQLIKKFEKQDENYIKREQLFKNLKFKRDKYIFYLFIKMVKSEVNNKKIQQTKNFFKKIGVFPIKYYRGDEFSRKKFWTLYLMFHNYTFLALYQKFKKFGVLK